MDDKETLHRRSRLRELVNVCFLGSRSELVSHIEERTKKKPNEGELSGLQKDNGPRSFGDKKARTLCEQIGLHRRWFDMPLGANLDRERWLDGHGGFPSEATPAEIATAFTEGSNEKREALTLLARLPDVEAAAILPLIKSILTKYE